MINPSSPIHTPAGNYLVNDAIAILDARIGACNYESNTNPTTNNDENDTANIGMTFGKGSKWFHGDTVYICVDATVGNADWVNLTSGGGGGGGSQSLDDTLTIGATTAQVPTFSGGIDLSGGTINGGSGATLVDDGSGNWTVAGNSKYSGGFAVGPSALIQNSNGNGGINFDSTNIVAIAYGDGNNYIDWTNNEDYFGYRDTSRPGVKLQIDSRGAYGRFQIYTQNADSNDEFCPVAIGEDNSVFLVGGYALTPSGGGHLIVGANLDDSSGAILQTHGGVSLNGGTINGGSGATLADDGSGNWLFNGSPISSGSTITSNSGTIASNGTLTVTHAADTSNLRECFATGTITLAGSQQVPTMTSNTAPSGAIISASSIGGGAPWQAFSGHGETDGGWYWAPNGPITTSTPEWIQVQFSSATIIATYALYMLHAATYRLTKWIMQGSNDGVTFTDLDTQTGQTLAGSGANTYTISSPASYLYYRLLCQETGGNAVVFLDALGLSTAGASVTGSIDCGHSVLDSAKTDRFLITYTSDTTTTFKNGYGQSVDAVVSVRV